MYLLAAKGLSDLIFPRIRIRRSPPVSKKERELASPRPILLYAILGIGIALRLAGIFSELSIDEIWSVYLAQHAKSAGDILFSTSHDNNHPLNSLILRLIGAVGDARLYRAPALIAGILIPIGGWWLSQDARWAARFAFTALLAGSWALTFYSTEARGYSYMLFFGLLALAALRRYLRKPTLWASLLYTLLSLAAALSHFSYLRCFISIALISTVWPDDWPLKRRIFLLLRCHLAPAVCLSAIYFTSIRGIYVAGGQFGSSAAVLSNTLAIALGGFPLEVTCTAAQVFLNAGLTALALLLCVCGIWLLAKGRRSRLIVLLLAMFIVPVLSVLAMTTPAIFPRYFLPEILLLYFIIAFFGAELARTGKAAALASSVLIGTVIGLNIGQSLNFVRQGRGSVLRALLIAAEASNGQPVKVAAHGDEALSWLVDHYISNGSVPNLGRDDSQPDWVIESSRNQCIQPANILQSGARRFLLQNSFPTCGLSGSRVTLFRSID